MANKYLKRCLTSFVIKKVQIKATMKYHFIPTRMATIIFFFFFFLIKINVGVPTVAQWK